MLHVVIMAGGSGTRFWPRSRKARPKQLIWIAGHQSMLAAAYERATGVADPENIWGVTTGDLAGAIREELPKPPKPNLLPAPACRDTAPRATTRPNPTRNHHPTQRLHLLPVARIE